MSHPYDFQDRLTHTFPSQVICDVTEICNLSCIHCPHSSFKTSEHYGARHIEANLNKKLVDEVKTFGHKSCQYMRYTADGEPMTHPQIFSILEYAILNSGVPVALTTNGTIFQTEGFSRLFSIGLHLIDVSVDAYSEEVYATVRGRGSLTNHVAPNIEAMLSLRRKLNSSTKIGVSFIQQPENTHEVSQFKDHWLRKGVDFVVIRRLHSAAGHLVHIAKRMKEHLTRHDRKPCLYPWERIVLNARGYLSFCPADWVRGAELADFRSSSIKELWQGPAYAKLRQAHLENDFKDHTFCGNCPDWCQTRWPFEGRSYANLVQDFLELNPQDSYSEPCSQLGTSEMA